MFTLVLQSQHGEPGTALVAILVAMNAVPVGVVLFVFRQRLKPRWRQIEIFTARFDGRSVVYLRRWHWSIDERTAREIARRHGYMEREPGSFALKFVPIRRAYR